MIQLTAAAKHFGGRTLFADADWQISDNVCVGLVGANGTGKTTLLRILAGEETLDAGRIIQTRGQKVGYLPQDGLALAGRSLFEECRSVFADLLDMQQELRDVEHRLTELDHQDATGAEATRLHERYAELLHLFEVRGGFSLEARIGTVLSGLGFSTEEWQKDCAEFSGGWQMRIALAKLLLAQPEVLLLDEPTNHLDLEARNWLEDYLHQYPFACIVVSHDRFFLDALVTKIAELGMSRLTLYSGNYTAYLKQREQRLVELQAAHDNQMVKRHQLEVFINRFRYTATKASQVQSRIKELGRMETIELPPPVEAIHFRFPQPPPSGRRTLELRGVEKSYGPKRVFDHLDLILERGEKVALVGHNGAGKSTLIRLLAGVEPFDLGARTVGHGVTLDHFAQDQYKVLDPEKRMLDDLTSVAPVLMVPNLRNLLGCFLFREDDVFKRIGVLSGGERNRYALARMLLQPSNLLLMDEPTNHLDMRAKDVLLEALQQFSGSLVFVSHDRYFINGLATKVIEVGGGGIEVYPGNYEDYLYRKERGGPGAFIEAPALNAPVKPSLPKDKAPNAGKKRLNPQRQDAMRDEVKTLEEEISRIEAEMQVLEGAMSRQDTYRDGAKAQTTVARYEEQRDRRAKLYAKWEQRMAALEVES